MHKSSIQMSVAQLKKWHDKGILRYDLAFQRSSGQWTFLQESLLIHSLLSRVLPVPALYFVKSQDESGETSYSVLDGLQRLTTIFRYIGDKGFRLHNDVPKVGDFGEGSNSTAGEGYDIAGKGFKDLPEPLQSAIENYKLTVYCLEDYDMEQLEDCFARLNASTPLTTVQKARTALGSELSAVLKVWNKSDFFWQACNFTSAQKKRESDFEVLLQAMLLLEARKGYNYKGISMADLTLFCKWIRNRYSEDDQKTMEDLLEYLSDAFTERVKSLRKTNIPMVLVLSKLAMEVNVVPEDFHDFIINYFNSFPADYIENMGSGNVKRSKTEGRLVALYRGFLRYFNLKETEVLSPVYVENSQVEADSPSPVVEKVEESENTEVVDESLLHEAQ